MKPNEAEITWCLANRELVMRWLEQRGGWQEGDWYVPVGNLAAFLVDRHELWAFHRHGKSLYRSEAVWLPSVGDVLEMLAAKGLRDICFYWIYGIWGYRAMLSKGSVKGEGKTHLIALMELAKASEA